MDKIVVKEKEISITGCSDEDYVSLTDIAKFKNPRDPNGVILNWMRRVFTLEYLSLWEKINNPSFKPTDFEGFKSKPGENAFTMSPKRWIELTMAKGVIVKSGRYNGGTYAHKDIALEFASWISPEVKLYIIKEFQRLKIKESNELEWQGSRFLTKLNYLIHTETIKEYLITVELSEEQISYIYATEADLLNVALFGKRASEWKKVNPHLNGNIRDHANAIELAILSNLEFYNSKLIENKLSSKERIVLLNKEANKEKEIFNKNQMIIKNKN
jgi:hypothetical protein